MLFKEIIIQPEPFILIFLFKEISTEPEPFILFCYLRKVLFNQSLFILILLFKEISIPPELSSPPRVRQNPWGGSKSVAVKEGQKCLCLICD